MCDSCNVLNINGINCHETGCPDAWEDYLSECVWCGQEFKPKWKNQQYCSDSCMYDDEGITAY